MKVPGNSLLTPFSVDASSGPSGKKPSETPANLSMSPDGLVLGDANKDPVADARAQLESMQAANEAARDKAKFDESLYEYMRPACDGRRVVQKDGQWGVVDAESGQEVVAFGKYDHYIGPPQNGRQLVKNGDLVGRTLLDPNDKFAYALIDMADGKEIVPLGKYHSIREERGGERIVSEGFGIIGVINETDGKEIIPPGKYDFIEPVSEGRRVIGEYGQDGEVHAGLTDAADQKEIVPVGKYDIIQKSRNGRCIVFNYAPDGRPVLIFGGEGKYGLIEASDGKEVISPQYASREEVEAQERILYGNQSSLHR